MNTRLVRSLALTTAALFALPTLAAHAEGWGTLTGRIAVVGEVPEPKPLNVGPAICNAFNLKDERLIVNRTNGGLANVCIWLSANRRGDAKPAIHPELQDLVNAKVILDNRNCRFEPHVAVMWTEQIVELVNSDPIGHNVNLSTLNRANISINQLIPSKRSVEYRIEADELLPVQVQCNIHPWMKGWILVKDTPYATITDSDGKFVIDKIPAGKWKFRFWHEEIGWIQKVAINGEEQKWRRGEVELVIADQQVLDLGKIEVGLKK